MIRLSDVAEAAGVSISVASRVLNEDPSLRIRETTRQRVLKAAKKLQYRPHFAGRALRTSQAGALALLVPDVNNPMFAALLAGVEDAAAEQDFIVLLGRSENVRPENDLLHRLLAEGRADGFLLQRRDEEQDAALKMLVERNVPAVLVVSKSSGRRGSVVLDDRAAGRMAVEHLLGLGHREIGLISGLSHIDTARRREDGYKQALRDAGVRRKEAWTTRLGYSANDGRRAVAELVERGPLPTALVVGNVNAAFGVLSATREMGILVPKDLSVIAVHDAWTAEYVWPPLTTIKLPLYELGRTAVQHLTAQLAGAKPTDEVLTEPSPIVIERASTDQPR